jgi:hypothetical protein
LYGLFSKESDSLFHGREFLDEHLEIFHPPNDRGCTLLMLFRPELEDGIFYFYVITASNPLTFLTFIGVALFT